MNKSEKFKPFIKHERERIEKFFRGSHVFLFVKVLLMKGKTQWKKT